LPRLTDAPDMQHAPARLVARYRIVLQRDGQEFLASVAELPAVRTRAAQPDDAVNVLRATASVVVAPLYTKGSAPTPLRMSQGTLGAWTQDLKLIDAVAKGATAGVEKPSPAALRSIAEATVDDYRMVLEEDEDGGFVGAGAEMPEVVVDGATPADTVQKLRGALVEAVFALLDANRMPPEALRGVEARRGVRPQPRRVAQAA
jgi:predicted RNase H-like HicB family nuclease